MKQKTFVWSFNCHKTNELFYNFFSWDLFFGILYESFMLPKKYSGFEWIDQWDFWVFSTYTRCCHMRVISFIRKRRRNVSFKLLPFFYICSKRLWEKLHTMRRLFTGIHVIIKKGIWKYFWNDFYFLALKLRLTFVNTRYFTSQLFYCWMKAIFVQELSGIFNLALNTLGIFYKEFDTKLKKGRPT